VAGLLDLDRMRDMAQGCGWTLAQLAEAYMRNTGAELRSLRGAVDAGALRDVERLAHGLAGAAATVGIAGMVHFFERIEREAASGDADALVAAAEKQFTAVSDELNALRA
jgi:HPt (histidine-containing phosphotransfer) domain-containing protein